MQTVQETSSTDERLLTLAAEIDAFEGYMHPHAARIAALADAVAKKFNLSPHDRFSLRQAALVHDIGEVVMNRDYIKASRALRGDERIDMQRHPVIGEQEAARRGFSRAVQLLVRWHHEWWSGAGYPDALERDFIPLAARILRVCDTYAALTDARPYKAAISETEAKKYLTEWAGLEFDPLVVKIFLSLEGLKELASFDVSEQVRMPEPSISDAPENEPVFAAGAAAATEETERDFGGISETKEDSAAGEEPKEDFSGNDETKDYFDGGSDNDDSDENRADDSEQNSPYSRLWDDNK
ncbi:MAG: HD domain-containing protein [Acidobacteriota bacterium]|nr:HD domain-containing protein [Acidobacteriota bacterium]